MKPQAILEALLPDNVDSVTISNHLGSITIGARMFSLEFEGTFGKITYDTIINNVNADDSLTSCIADVASIISVNTEYVYKRFGAVSNLIVNLKS